MQSQTFLKSFLKASIFGLCFFTFSTHLSMAQNAGSTEQQIIALSNDKWQWMADKDVDKLGKFFDDKAKMKAN